MAEVDESSRMSRRGLLKLAGAGAVTLGVGAVTLGLADPAFATQDGWRWCKDCNGLVYGGFSTAGPCFGETMFGHDLSDSLGYLVKMSWEGGAGQTGWKWCINCNLMNFGNGTSAKYACPGGPTLQGVPHNNTQSATYIIEYSGNSDGVGGQDNWRWCTVCGGLFYHGETEFTDRSCTPGGPVSHQAGGTDYIVRY
jgi:hypothetical protein